MYEWIWLILLGIGIPAAGLLFRRPSRGIVVVHFLVGLAGAIGGGLLFRLLGLRAYGSSGPLLAGIVGALMLLMLAGWIRDSERAPNGGPGHKKE
ncbi:MAG TPA: GlsB/YeaQ/YmgE family stress response membrane protein [Phycisphaerae bacterium]|nr:GlsB/YeaQ/YmgE family stress response membrane protein [Phycisphaerae bacterium]